MYGVVYVYVVCCYVLVMWLCVYGWLCGLCWFVVHCIVLGVLYYRVLHCSALCCIVALVCVVLYVFVGVRVWLLVLLLLLLLLLLCL